MAVLKYANLDSVERISQYVNRKLTVVDSMPSSPELGTVLYIGDETEEYVQGGIYLYDETEEDWMLISAVDVDLSNYETAWTGTHDDWLLLTPEEQANYEIIRFTDDYVESGDPTGVVAGYYYNGKFYEDDQHTIEISGLTGYIYINLTKHKLYLYDGSEYVINSVVEGYYNSTDGKFYAESTYDTELPRQDSLLYVDLATTFVYRYDVITTTFIHVNNYTAGYGINIANGQISTRSFVGTHTLWETLTPEQQAYYIDVNFTDDVDYPQVAGHEILNDAGTSMTQRTGLQFKGLVVTDDSTNDKTIVSVKASPKIYKKILTAGSTTVTFAGLPTSGDYLIDFFTSTGIGYTMEIIAEGSVRLTFEAQNQNVTVYCKVEKVEEYMMIYSQTLAAGATSVTFTDLPTTGDYTADFYTSNGTLFKSIDTSVAGRAVLTFDAQSSAITVFCKLEEV